MIDWTKNLLPPAAPKPVEDTECPIVWAVWLGANTASRLANEWGITAKSAGMRLAYAEQTGRLRRNGRGNGKQIRYRVTRSIAWRGSSYGGAGMDVARNLPNAP